MSPKSRGRPKGRGRTVKRHPGGVPAHARSLSEEMLFKASVVGAETDPLEAERWASEWLGVAWFEAAMGERTAEHDLCADVARRATNRPSPRGLAAVAALLRVAPPAEEPLLRDAIALLAEGRPVPVWHDAPAPEPVAAWRAVDVWDSEHALLVEYGGPTPHVLMGRVNQVGGVMVDTLLLLTPGIAERWSDFRQDGEPPMPLVEASAADVLTELASALRITDMTLPRPDDEHFVELRALAWSRCRAHLGPWPELDQLDDPGRVELLEAFWALPEVKALAAAKGAVAHVSSLCLDYGEGYIPSGHLCWSPLQVGLFLTDWLPRKASLDADDRAALPDVLRAWIRFALRRRDVPEEWITPVTLAVEEYLPEFTEAFGDASTAGPAKQVRAQLEEMGVDLTDADAVADGIRAVNAGYLARQLLDE